MIDRIIPITDPQPSLQPDHHEEGVTKVALIRPLCTVHSISYFPFLLLASLPHLNYYYLIPDLSPYIHVCISLFSHSSTHSLSPSLLFNLSLFSSLQSSLTLFSPNPPPPPSTSFPSSSSHPHPSPHLSFSQDLVPSTRVKKRFGRELTAVNDSVLDKNQPYLTTNNR